ncbi:hypothetical protein OESDEN_20923 [Oesophagostomum dentatum]|uniref:Acyltransferase 3 domain-containing protein n=1 Tax=Oesophagostomum dentatum TaxID=61180 RepID=A0A0B1S6B1_OESDE|nr:hypothetical protein OESDEN_20923 [Oesophagostomum dentatum]
MDHPIWQPLGRLSYCGYIVHMFLIHYVYNLDDRPAHFVSIWRTYIHLIIPNIVVSYVFSFFWSCLFEVPIVKLEKLLTAGLLPSKNKQSVQPIQPKSALASTSDDAKEKTVNEGALPSITGNTEDQKAASDGTLPESVVVKLPQEGVGESNVTGAQNSTITTNAQVHDEGPNESNVYPKL